MNQYAVLSNRKRAIIALIHSVFFLMVAFMGAFSQPIQPVWIRIHDAVGAAVSMIAVYAIVTTILLILTKISRCSIERLYFGFCAASAGTGLIRLILGDAPHHLAVFVRVLMLSLAVFTGLIILREHSQPELAD